VIVDLTLIRDRLTAQTSIKKVGNAADLDAVMRGGIPTLPAAYVLPLGESGEEPDMMENTYMQHVAAQFGVVIAVRDLTDAQGDAALEALRPISKEVDDALVNWSPDGDELDPIGYAGGQLIGFRDQVIFWQKDFVTGFYIRK
jgi:hypothetical protein